MRPPITVIPASIVNRDSSESKAKVLLSACGRNTQIRDHRRVRINLCCEPGTKMKHSVGTLMDEIRSKVELFESNRPKHLDAFALSQESKVPAKVLRYRESLIWRVAELGRAAFREFEENRLVAGIVLTRAVAETSAALWYLRSKVDDAIKSNQLGDIDSYLVKLNVGIATAPPKTEDGEFPRPVKIGKFLDQVEKVMEGFSEHYGILSEYAHPNWAGTVSLYSKFHTENLTIDFGQYIRSGEQAKALGVNSLHGSLGLFEMTYNNLSASMPAFVELCEKNLKPK